MKLRLEHGTNPDIGYRGGYWVQPVDQRRMEVEVESLTQASRELMDWVDRNELGCGNMAGHCGEVTVDGRVVAKVSYNGRVWTPEPWPDQSELVADGGQGA